MPRILKQNQLLKVTCLLFGADVAELKRAAVETGAKWQTSLRHLIRRAIARERIEREREKRLTILPERR